MGGLPELNRSKGALESRRLTKTLFADWRLQRFEQLNGWNYWNDLNRARRVLLPHHGDRDSSRNDRRRAKHGTEVDPLNPAQE
jgi:hypothetical protein